MMHRSKIKVRSIGVFGFLFAAVAVFQLTVGLAAAEDKRTIHGPILTWHEKPTTTITVTWVERRADHATADASKQWRSGSAGFGYGDGDDNTVLRDMRDRYSRLYIRKTFVLDAEANDEQATLRIRYDDAFIAYLNGHEVARRGVKKGRGRDAAGIDSHESGSEYDTIKIDQWVKLAKRGQNVLAIEAHNTGAGSSDLTLDPYLTVSTKGKLKVLISRHALWDYLAGADPKDDWTTLAFKPQVDKPVTDEVPATKPDSMKPTAWVTPLGKDQWQRVDGKSRPFADTGGRVHVVHVEGLNPGSDYSVKIGVDKPADATGSLLFRTAPAKLSDSLCFVTGGDMGVGSVAQAMNRQAGQSDPLFALLGGDLAYANGRDAAKWYLWLDNWKQQAVTPDGRTVPIVICIGNHEMGSKLNEATARKLETHPKSKFFFSLFTLPDSHTNYVLDFGAYLSVFVLDSDHAQRVGDQTEWLANVLAARTQVPHTFACYHRPAYGTAKSPNKSIRQEWSPLFEKYSVDAVFENDHHTYKRTFPIRAGEVDHDRGVLYLGDGAWGVGTRKVPNLELRKENAAVRVDPKTKQEIWHLARAESRNHLWRVTVTPNDVRYEAVDQEGNVFDRWPNPPAKSGAGR